MPVHSIARYRMNRRRMLTGIAAAAAGATLGNGLTTAPGRAQQTEIPKILFGDITVAGIDASTNNPMVSARVNAFKEANRRVDVTVDPELDDSTLLSKMADRNLPDVMWLDRFDTAYWAANGAILPLFGYFRRKDYDVSAFYPAAIDEVTFDNLQFGLPGDTDIQLLFVNLDHLQEAGIDPASIDSSNWDQLAEIGTALGRRNGETIERLGFDAGFTRESLWLWGEGNGGQFVNDDGTSLTFTNDGVVDALDRGAAILADQGGFDAVTAFTSTSSLGQAFVDGRISMLIADQRVLTDAIVTMAPTMHFAALPLRHRGSGASGPVVSISNGGSWSISSTSSADEADIAWALIDYMTSDRGWATGATATLSLLGELNRPFIPTLSGSTTADAMQAKYVYEPISGAIDSTVALLPGLAAQARCRPTARFIGGRQINQILMDTAVTPVLRGEARSADALATANDLAQRVVSAF